MKNKYLKYLLILIIINLIIISCENPESSFKSSKPSRESVKDRIVTTQDSVIWDLPDIPRLCDGIDLKKSSVNVGSCKLYVEEEGKGIPIVLLHGGPGATHHEFHPAFSEAAKYARIIYYDQRGCGLSDHVSGEEGYSVKQAAEDLDNLRVQLGIEKWILVGHSFGGFLAQYYSTLYPESTLGLVLICSSTGLHNMELLNTRQYDYLSKKEQIAMRRFESEIRKTGKENGASKKEILALTVYNNMLNGDWKRQSYYRPTTEEMARAAIYNWDHDLENNFNRQMSRSKRSVSLAGAFENCPIPTMIIESVWDLSWTEAKAMLLAKNHPGAEVSIFTKSAHAPFIDEPLAFFERLESFIQQIKPLPDYKLQEYSLRMKNFKPLLNDEFISGQASPEEAIAIEEFRKIKLCIQQGDVYFDLSTPLRVELSFISAIINKDLNSARKIQSRDWTLQSLTEDSYWIDQTSIWRAPTPPEKPKQGQIWPIYVTEKDSGEWVDTLIYIFWDGQWQKAGNQGGPYYDWRDSELFFIKEQLKTLK